MVLNFSLGIDLEETKLTGQTREKGCNKDNLLLL
jgi:hypothetical protein